MSFAEPTLIQQLNSRMSYLSERQAVLAKNIANIDTPGYRAQDLVKQDFSEMVKETGVKLWMKTTSDKHIDVNSKGTHYAVNTNYKAVSQKPGGNNVILEEQMGNISDTGAQHQMASTLLRKYHQLYRMALDNKA